MTHQYTVSGTVSTPAGPLDGATVTAVDSELGRDDPLATAETAADGGYELSFDGSALDGPFEGSPDVYLRVSHSGLSHETDAVDFDDGTATLDVALGEDAAGAGTSGDAGSGTVGDGGRPSSGGSMASGGKPHHGMVEHRGMRNVPRDPSHPGQGRFGRLFPNLSPADHDVRFLEELGLPGGVLEETPDDPVGDADTVPAGFVFLGQFIDHDITLDPVSSLERQADPDALRNFRTPRLDLDSVYGAGPEAQPFLYRADDGEKLLLGENDAGERADLPRNAEGTALTGDPRNDENLILSQFQTAMLRFHNQVVDHLRAESDAHEVFEEAQQLVRWHYQWIVLHEYLPTICGEDAVEHALQERELYEVETGENAYMPVEFAGAVYRFGHSQARFEYRINDEFGAGRLFGPPGADDVLNQGFEAVPPEKVVDWRHLFDFRGDVDPQMAREIDPKVAPDLLDLPFVSDDNPAFEQSLASRNLVRGHTLGLPSGPAVARRLGEEPLTNAETGFDEAVDRYDPDGSAEMPLWYYVLAEASAETGGEQLGTVGGRIVAEVIVGLLESDPRSFLTIQPAWTPTLPTPVSGDAEDYSTADLLSVAMGY